MKRLISKMIIALLVAMFTCSSIFAASAKVTYVKGKVEVSNGSGWVTLKVGDVVNESETISTGFQSEARLNYNGSVMAVPALSRVTLEALQSSGSKDTVSIKVDTGAVRSKVTHTEGKRIEYTARTPVGVASVRGTDFAVFANGRARVFAGAVAYYKASDFIPPLAHKEVADDASGEDKGPASATTAAEDIVSSAPINAIVVAAGQTSIIGENGIASKPLVEAKKIINQVIAALATASEQDAMAANLSTSSTDSSNKEVQATGSVKLFITLDM